MAQRPMTPNEKRVGRRLPREPFYTDLFMAGFVKKDGSFCSSSEPAESYMRPAFLKAKKKRWIKFHSRLSLMGGKPFGIFILTEAGKIEAKSAVKKVKKARAARQEWVKDFQAIHLAQVKASKRNESEEDIDLAP